MKCTTAALALATILCTGNAVFAADLGGATYDSKMGTVPAATWTGFYLGANVGYAWGAWDGRLETTAGNPPDNYAGYIDPERSLSGDGWLGGATIGAQLQRGNLVLGIEADYSWAGIEGSATYTTDDYNGDYAKKHTLSVDNLGTARIRLGYPTGKFLPYITGGVAWAETHGDLSISYPNAQPGVWTYDHPSTASTDETHIGWTIGGGLETDLGAGWSVKAEYLYVDLGSQPYAFNGICGDGKTPFDTDSFPADLTLNVFRVGLNRRF